jgi:Arabidopsis protein of unknown function
VYRVDLTSRDSFCLLAMVVNFIYKQVQRHRIKLIQPSSLLRSITKAKTPFFYKQIKKMACHIRSNSLPARSHSFVLKAEEELNKVKAYVGSSSLTYEIMIDAIKAVGRVYECINDILCMSSNQNCLSQWQQRRWIDQELEESIRFLDICSTLRENLDAMKCYIHDQETAIRRGESKAIKSSVRDLSNLVKKACKDVKKYVPRKGESLDEESLACASLIMETRELTLSLLQAVFSSFTKQIVQEKCSKWSLSSKLLQKRSAAYQGEKRDDIMDIATLLVNVEGLDSGLECLFRHLIQCRVSLLNICTL